jgi:hypothetical protein
MRYRKLDANGDYSWGHGQADFWVDQPEAVAQAILTRLKLWTGEWFLDLSEGTAWMPNVPTAGDPGVVGAQSANAQRDIILQNRILGTQGVKSLISYSSRVDPVARRFFVFATVDTIYSTQPVNVALGLGPAGWFAPEQSAFGGELLAP